MKKIVGSLGLKIKNKMVYILFLFLFSLFSMFLICYQQNLAFSDNSPNSVRVIYDTAGIYSTTDVFSLSIEELELVTLYEANLHEIFDVVSEEGDFYLVKIDEAQNGYILKSACIDNSITSPIKVLSTNAIVIKESVLFNNNLQQIPDITLSEGKRVKILSGWDSSIDYTHITYQNDDGVLLSYYIETANLSPDGIDYSVVLAVSMIITLASIGLILMKIIKPKISKNKKA